LRLKLAEKEHVIHGLQERVGDAESTLQETSARLSHALDEQVGRKITPCAFTFFCSSSPLYAA
jgi:hypothetical protein